MTTEFIAKLVCPVTKIPLRLEDASVVRLENASVYGREITGWLICEVGEGPPPPDAPEGLKGYAYPVVDGIPVLLVDARVGLVGGIP